MRKDIALICTAILALMAAFNVFVIYLKSRAHISAESASHSESTLPILKTFGQTPLIPDYSSKCPEWRPYDKRSQIVKNFGDCRNVHLESTTNFTAMLCESKEFCGQGYFVITRIDKDYCRQEMERPLSYNSHLEEYYRSAIGPDSFHLIFDGPQKETPPMWTHLGNCVYKLPFRLTNPGSYSIQLIHAYDAFKAVNELTPVRPEPLFTQLLPKNFSISICPECPVFTSKQLDALKLPLCSRSEPQQGVFLKMTLETERERRHFKTHQHGYIWEPLGCKFDHRFGTDADSICHRRRNISIAAMGDSQMRSQVLGLDHRLIPNNENEIPHKNYLQLHMKYYDVSENPASNRLIISLDSNKLMNSENAYVGRNHTEITFTFMRFMDNFINTDSYTGFDDAKQAAATEEMLLNYDKLIINHGHWAMHSYQIGGHYSVERYVDSIEYGADLIDLINRRRHIHHKEPLDVVWNGINAFPLLSPETREHAKPHEWRTNYRLKVWSDYAEQVFRRRGLKMMNSFEITLPWTQHSLDYNHLDYTPAIEGQVDEVLHKLGLCNSS